MSEIISYVGLLISLLFLIYKSKEGFFYFCLIGFYFIISLHALFKNTLIDNKFIDVHILYPLVFPFFFCSGPLLYLFIKKVFSDDKDQNLKIYEDRKSVV